MPSLQQINLKDCSTPDITRTLTGSDILHKHSINSLLEQNDMINRGLASPMEGDTLSTFPDIFGNNSNSNINATNQYQLGGKHHNSSFGSTQSSGSSIGNTFFPNGNSTYVSDTKQQKSSTNHMVHQNTGTNNNGVYNGNNNMQSSKTTHDNNNFQFENGYNGTGQNTATMGGMKTMQRNHLTLDCTPASPRNFPQSPLFSNNGFNNLDSNLLQNNWHQFNGNNYRSASPTDYNDNSGLLSGLENHNLIDLMSYLTLNPGTAPVYQQPQASTPFGSVGSGGSGCTSPMSPADFDLARYQNLQALNTLRMYQQQQQQQHQQMAFNPFTLNQLLHTYSMNQYKNWQLPPTPCTPTTPTADPGLDRVAKFHRSSAALHDPTCTWSGVLPPRSHRMMTYSSKVFLGGIPWDISEQSLIQIFKQFGPIKVEWPGKEQQASQPKGYVYVIFESEKAVKSLLQACHQSDYSSSSGSIPSTISSDPNNYYFKISSKRIKAKQVEVIPWIIGDSNFVKSTSQKLDPTKTVFVGALHGKLTAEGLAKIMNDLFDGVIYAGIDTDKYKYPIGSGRVTFNNTRSYMKAVSAAFIEIKTSKFTKKVQIDPYLEDSLCAVCGVQHGPYYCRELVCFRYYCRTCWALHHNSDPNNRTHKPLTRNSKSTQIIGVGPQQSSTPTTPTTPNVINSIAAFSSNL